MITGSRWIRCVRGLKCSWRLSEFDVGRLELRINARAVAHHATGVFAAVVRGHIAVHARFEVVVVVVGARDGEETFHGWALLCCVTVPAKAVAVDVSVWQAAGVP